MLGWIRVSGQAVRDIDGAVVFVLFILFVLELNRSVFVIGNEVVLSVELVFFFFVFFSTVIFNSFYRGTRAITRAKKHQDMTVSHRKSR